MAARWGAPCYDRGMTKRKIAPYGSWKSPVTAEMIARHSIKFGSVVLDGDETYWIEMRPGEAGRNVIVQRDAQGVEK